MFCEKAKQMTKEEWELEQQPILNVSVNFCGPLRLFISRGEPYRII